MEIEYGSPMKGFALSELKAFLRSAELDYDEQIQYTVCLTENDEIIATGSLDKNVLKCIAVSPAHQGEGLTATLLSDLRKEAFRRGQEHLFLFTKPKNRWMFEDLYFYPIAQTADMLLMESRRNGIRDFVDALEKIPVTGRIGAIVMNCDPFTLGHRYLIETASKECEHLHIFVLSENRSHLPPEVRRELLQKGVADLPNVTIHPTGDYLISAATFPAYFLKNKADPEKAKCELDLEIFCKWFVPALGISRRYVGTEPLSPVTEAYNRAMQAYLPPRGVEVRVIPRREEGGAPISASRVRTLWQEGNTDALRSLVPETTLAYLTAHRL